MNTNLIQQLKQTKSSLITIEYLLINSYIENFNIDEFVENEADMFESNERNKINTTKLALLSNFSYYVCCEIFDIFEDENFWNEMCEIFPIIIGKCDNSGATDTPIDIIQIIFEEDKIEKIETILFEKIFSLYSSCLNKLTEHLIN